MMRQIAFFLLFITEACKIQAQMPDWFGNWGGELSFNSQKLHVLFNVTPKYTGWYSKISVVEQSAKPFTVSSTETEGEIITFTMDLFGAKFRGKRLDSNTISGKFTQNGKSQNLKLKRVWGLWPEPKPQTPLPPYPYVSEEVKIHTANGRVKIAGTLSKPDSTGKFPVIILISGSGPQDRDGSIGLHKPFRILADTFTKMGFAVLRCDDRGAGQTTGHPETLAKTTTADQAADVETFIAFLKLRSDIDTTRIGLLGHSEGGIIAPMVAARRKEVRFIVILAGSAGGGKNINIAQNKLIYEQIGVKGRHLKAAIKLHTRLVDAAIGSADTFVFKQKFHSEIRQWKKRESTIKTRLMWYGFRGKNVKRTYSQYKVLMSPWMHYFLQYNPQEDLQNVQCAILALNGDKDIQVPIDPHLNILKRHIDSAQNKTSKAMVIPGVNHLFQTCKTCKAAEYNSLEESFSPKAIKEICSWLELQKK